MGILKSGINEKIDQLRDSTGRLRKQGRIHDHNGNWQDHKFIRTKYTRLRNRKRLSCAGRQRYFPCRI